MASEKRIDEICKSIHADSLWYTPIERIIEALVIKKENLCLGCVTGEYPLFIPNETHRFPETVGKMDEIRPSEILCLHWHQLLYNIA